MATPALAAMGNLFTATTRLAQHSHLFELVPARPFAPADLDRLDAHIGPYDRVAQSGSFTAAAIQAPGSVDSSARRGTRPMSTISCALYQLYLGPH